MSTPVAPADPATPRAVTPGTAPAAAVGAEPALHGPEPAALAAAPRGLVRLRAWPGWLRELAIVLTVYAFYSVSRNLIPNHVATAQANARAILHAERVLGVDVELGINHWGAARPWLVVPLNYYYATLHLTVTAVVMVWLYRRRHAVYARCRNVLLTMTLMALVCYWLYPLAPPRLMVGEPFVDTVKEYVLWGFTPSEDLVALSNQYAAMPSMHVGWALWVGAVLVWFGRGRVVRALGVAYPLVTTFVVVVTANHFVLDAVAAVLFFAVALAAVDVVGRVTGRPAVPPA
ncbi:MAG: phosphatase PAP2 family protein [Actinomycetales bacterium]|nr:phosphatase PAP2 family protein [Actinomycetales bacterium]